MFTPVKKSLIIAIVIMCLLVPSFGYAAIGTEPSTQTSEAVNPLSGPLPSVPSSPGFLPGMQGEGTTSYPPMNFSSSPEANAPYYPQYAPAMPQNAEGMAGMMMMSPYPSYAEGSEMYPSTYQDPYQSPWGPSMPGMGYTGMDSPYAPGMGYPEMNTPYAQGMGYPGMNAPYAPGMGYPDMNVGYPPYAQQYGSADEMYNRARDAYTSGNYRYALSMFQQVATWYPQSDLADNAYYWIGEIYYTGKNYPAAIQSFQTVMYSYPSGNKFPDAMVKMGYAYAEMRQYGIARSILNDVVSRFNNNARIRNLAVKKLNELGNY
ncbi:tol-pal system protein YbgF [Candidatus Vecturithrix granuli]|uniref:Tol-pal system protein YbgF n=1 Tax=Vecturithrix granuli TaxID=1499967 RepID=A0A081C9A3_VECG1|nr:tol-pal system protein YbgF [Candidatus Vecturithrix granuli]